MSLIDDFRNGKRYGADWKAPTVQHMNNLVETISNDDLMVNSLASTPDNTEANKVGTVEVEIIGDGVDKKFKFKNLKGEQGDKGEKGDRSTIKIGTITTGQPGDLARVENVGTQQDAIFNFYLPQGPKGDQGYKGNTGKGYAAKGDWISGISYVSDEYSMDTVYYNGATYYCKVSHTSNDNILPTNTTYWGLLVDAAPQDEASITYDTVIRTQAQFDAWVEAMNGGVYTGRSILIVGMGEPYTLSVTDTYGINFTNNSGITITGVGNAEITATIVNNSQSYIGVFGNGSGSSSYVPPTIQTITLNVNASSSMSSTKIYALYKIYHLNSVNLNMSVSLASECYGTYACRYLSNCVFEVSSGTTTQASVLKYCQHINNCRMSLTSTLASPSGDYAINTFIDCQHIVGSYGSVKSSSAGTVFQTCTEITSCKAYLNNPNGNTYDCAAFRTCENVFACVVMYSSTNTTVPLSNCVNYSFTDDDGVKYTDMVKAYQVRYGVGTTRTDQNDTVVEYYISSDGLTWYTKWASGLIRYGGRVSIGSVSTSGSSKTHTIMGVSFTKILGSTSSVWSGESRSKVVTNCGLDADDLTSLYIAACTTTGSASDITVNFEVWGY